MPGKAGSNPTRASRNESPGQLETTGTNVMPTRKLVSGYWHDGLISGERASRKLSVNVGSPGHMNMRIPVGLRTSVGTPEGTSGQKKERPHTGTAPALNHSLSYNLLSAY